MKLLFILLLVVNIGILIWSLQQRDSGTNQTLEAGVGNLRLLTQPKPQQPSSDAFASADSDGAVETPQAGDTPIIKSTTPALDPSTSLTAEAGRDSATEPSVSARKSTTGATAEQSNLQQPIPTDFGVAERSGAVEDDTAEGAVRSEIPSLNDEVIDLTLNSEDLESENQPLWPTTEHAAGSQPAEQGFQSVEADTTPVVPVPMTAASAANQEAAPATVPALILPVQICGVFGPVEDEELASSVKDQLAQSGLSASIRQEFRSKIKGYWVLIPPLGNRADSLAMVSKLKEAGEVDVMRFYKGENRNAVSLGLYSRRRNAEIRRGQVAKKGFQPEVRARTREVAVYLVDYQGAVGSYERAIERVRKAHQQLDHVSRTCAQVALP